MKTSVKIVLSFLLLLPTYAHAAKKKKTILCSKAGAILARVGKCKKGETVLGVNDLIQQAVSVSAVTGPQGDQGPAGSQGPKGVPGEKGDLGPVGPQGDPAGFDVAKCYTKVASSPSFGIPATSSSTLASNCNQPSTEFMLTSAFRAIPPGSNTRKPFVQSKSLNLDPTGKYPIGVEYVFLRGEPSPSDLWDAAIEILCCQR